MTGCCPKAYPPLKRLSAFFEQGNIKVNALGIRAYPLIMPCEDRGVL